MDITVIPMTVDDRVLPGHTVILDWKKRTSSGDLLRPAIHTAGPLLDGDPPLWPDNTVVRNAGEAQGAVVAQAQAGNDFIKVYNNLSAESYRAIIATAREHGLPVTGHVPRAVTIEAVFDSRQAAVEHLSDFDEAVEADDSPVQGQVPLVEADPRHAGDGAIAVRIPKHARKELESYLDCGLLCRGFARRKCEDCGERRRVRAGG